MTITLKNPSELFEPVVNRKQKEGRNILEVSLIKKKLI